jgi:hypothetical protein
MGLIKIIVLAPIAFHATLTLFSPWQTNGFPVSGCITLGAPLPSAFRSTTEHTPKLLISTH